MKRPIGFSMRPPPPDEFAPALAAPLPDDLASPATPKGAPKAPEKEERPSSNDESDEVDAPEPELEFAARLVAAAASPPTGWPLGAMMSLLISPNACCFRFVGSGTYPGGNGLLVPAPPEAE